MRLKQWRIDLLERGLAGLDRPVRNRGEEMPAHLLTGISFEDAAFFYLRRKGLHGGRAALGLRGLFQVMWT